jgi:hypothetical protein
MEPIDSVIAILEKMMAKWTTHWETTEIDPNPDMMPFAMEEH